MYKNMLDISTLNAIAKYNVIIRQITHSESNRNRVD